MLVILTAMAYARPILWPAPRMQAPRGRPQIAMVLGATPLEDEELQAVAGVWRLTLDLDDGLREISAQLTADGRVHTTDQALENYRGHGGGGRWWAEAAADRSAPAGASQSLKLTIRVADWTLLATGKREGLRCREMSGSILEGQDDPCYVGSLAMSLALPEVDDGAALAALEQRLRARLEARPAPPARFAREAFSGGWRMMIDFDGAVARTYSVTLHQDGTFATEEVPGLGGHWGVWGTGLAKGASEMGVLREGTHLWMRVERDRSTSTLVGMGGLRGVHESFSLWGRPQLDSLQAELSARAGGYAAGAARRRGARAVHAVVEHVSGAAFFGTASNEYYRAGRCSMVRGGGPQMGDSVGI